MKRLDPLPEDFPCWAEPLREELRDNAERIAAEAGLQIEFIRKLKAFRKEARIKEILAERGDHPGLVHIFSAMESCPSYRPWHDKSTHRTFLKPTSGECLHYDFYFIDEQVGLCYVRVPTWAPFRLQVYFNGHSWLARQLRQAGVAFDMLDNAFAFIADPGKAQQLADTLRAPMLHERRALWGPALLPGAAPLPLGLPLQLHAGRVCRRRGLSPPSRVPAPLRGDRAHRRSHHQGRARQRLLHPYPGHPHPSSHGSGQHQALRQVLPHRPHRVHRQRCLLLQTPPLRATAQRRARLQARPATQEHLQPQGPAPAHARRQRPLPRLHGCLDNPDAAHKAIAKMAAPAKAKGRSFRGFNLFLNRDYPLFLTLGRGEWAISGFRAADLRAHIEGLSPGRSSYIWKRLRTHGLIKKVAHTYKYYLTTLGRRVLVTALVIREYFVQPTVVRGAL